MDYKDNMEIDLIDLALYLLRRWKVMVVCAIVGAVLLGAFGYLKSGVVVDKETGEPVTVANSSNSNAAELRGKLTEPSAKYCEVAAEQYEDNMQNYMRAIEHNEKSPVLTMNAYDVFRVTKQYVMDDFVNGSNTSVSIRGAADGISSPLDSDLSGNTIEISNAESRLNNIVVAYSNELMTADTVAEIKKAIGADEELDATSIREMVRIVLDADSILTISTFGNTKEDAKAVMDVLDSHFDAATETVSGVYNYDITPVGTYYFEGYDGYILGLQTNSENTINTLRNYITGLSNAMSVEEKAYFNAIVADYLNENEEADATDDSSVETMVVRTVSKKYIAAGLVGGIFIVAFLYALFYVLSGKVHTADDIRRAFGISVIGEVKSNAGEFGLVSQGAAIGASKLSSNSVYIMGASDDDISVKIRNAICKEMNQDAHLSSVKAGSSAVNDAVSMKDLSDSDAVVLVEKIDKSRFEDVAREVELCKKFGVNILGAVVVR
ncbi:hypothetical protein [Butyrivibrio sp. LC3010]|uniref:hypothetical protein n=1 Tax=Butyrivibrio sp. LC3010 TaxID=1280680 RepID=UPI0004235142|nr:hypothetical protein [Butyrivibrio sp. LC3010]